MAKKVEKRLFPLTSVIGIIGVDQFLRNVIIFKYKNFKEELSLESWDALFKSDNIYDETPKHLKTILSEENAPVQEATSEKEI